MEKVSCIYTSPILDEDELKTVFRAFKKRVPGYCKVLHTFILTHPCFHLTAWPVGGYCALEWL